MGYTGPSSWSATEGRSCRSAHLATFALALATVALVIVGVIGLLSQGKAVADQARLETAAIEAQQQAAASGRLAGAGQAPF